MFPTRGRRGCPEFRGTWVAARWCSGCFFLIMAGGRDSAGGVIVEGPSEGSEVEVSVDASELFGGFWPSGGDPAALGCALSSERANASRADGRTPRSPHSRFRAPSKIRSPSDSRSSTSVSARCYDTPHVPLRRAESEAKDPGRQGYRHLRANPHWEGCRRARQAGSPQIQQRRGIHHAIGD